MSGRWSQECKMLLDQIKNLENLKGRDRLDVVRTIRLILFALDRSVTGWNEWINDPDIMTSFSLKELKEISKNLAKLSDPFIEYDCKVTSKASRDLTVKELETPSELAKKAKDESKIFYVQ